MEVFVLIIEGLGVQTRMVHSLVQSEVVCGNYYESAALGSSST